MLGPGPVLAGHKAMSLDGGRGAETTKQPATLTTETECIPFYETTDDAACARMIDPSGNSIPFHSVAGTALWNPRKFMQLGSEFRRSFLEGEFAHPDRTNGKVKRESILETSIQFKPKTRTQADLPTRSPRT
jgi:hypothetical protein